MSRLLMLDTNAVSALIRGNAESLADRLERQLSCISVITEAELRFGLARRAVNADLRRIAEAFLQAADIRSWDSKCAQHYTALRAALEAQGKPLAPMDLLIAAQALALRCTLVTADQSFRQVAELQIFDWSAV